MKKPRRPHDRPFRDEVPSLYAPSLKFLQDAETADLTIGGIRTIVSLYRRPGVQGTQTLFVCPSCSRHCRTLTAYQGRIGCPRCDDLAQPAERGSLAHRIASLKKRIAKPAKGANVILLEQALRLALITERKRRLASWKQWIEKRS